MIHDLKSEINDLTEDIKRSTQVLVKKVDELDHLLQNKIKDIEFDEEIKRTINDTYQQRKYSHSVRTSTINNVTRRVAMKRDFDEHKDKLIVSLSKDDANTNKIDSKVQTYDLNHSKDLNKEIEKDISEFFKF